MQLSPQKKPLVHVFVCESCRYQTADGSYCHPETAQILRKRVKELCKAASGKEDLRINGSACLGNCETGINAVIYPAGQHIQYLQEGDEQRLAELALASLERAKNL